MSMIDTDAMQSIGQVAAGIVAGLATERAWDRGQITEPGIYAGVPIDRYHGDPALFDGWSMSSSGLRAVLRRPSEYWMGSPFNPAREPGKPVKALEFGRAAHAILMGDEDATTLCVVSPFKDFRTDAAQAWRDAQVAARRTIVTNADMEAIRRIADALHRHPLIKQGLLSGRVERTMCAKAGDIWLKARPDAIPNSDGMFVDLKTAADVSDDGINRSIADKGYHVQAATIRMVARALGIPFEAFAFVFVEKIAPFDVRVKVLKDNDLDRGEQLARAALDATRRCIREGVWPGFDGFGNAEGYAEVPTWAASRETTFIETAKAERKAA